MQKWLTPLVFALPASMIGIILGWRPSVIFALALISLIPLAGFIGEYTERLSEYVGEVAGGLLDATFGNAPEIIIGILLITNVFFVGDALLIVQALIIGSIVSNALFVLGSSIFIGSVRNGRMTFSADQAGSYASMLALAVAGLALPALAVFLGNAGFRLSNLSDQVHLSVVVAIVLLVSYFAYLASSIFHVGEQGYAARKQAKTTSAGKTEETKTEETKAESEALAAAGMPAPGEHPSVPETQVERIVDAESADAATERKQLQASRKGHGRQIAYAIVMLVLATILTVVASVVLVSVMHVVIIRTALTPFFVGFILLPIITNAVEQLGAIRASHDNRMEEAMAIAAGSSVQMALLVAPLLVLLSVALGLAHPLTMVFSKLELIVATLVTFVYALVSLDGETTWLEGLQLVAFYAMVAATAFFLPGP